MGVVKKKWLETMEWSNEGRDHNKGKVESKWNRMKLKTLDSWIIVKPSLKTPTAWASKDGSQLQNQESESTTSSPSSLSALEKTKC